MTHGAGAGPGSVLCHHPGTHRRGGTCPRPAAPGRDTLRPGGAIQDLRGQHPGENSLCPAGVGAVRVRHRKAHGCEPVCRLPSAAGLEADGLETGGHKTKWHTSSINKILRNEKYMGDALLQKTYTIDFLTKKRIKNNGIVPQYYVEDNHPAIIPKKYYLLVQKELVKRRVVHTSSNGKKRNFSSNHVFANIVYCGNCGEIFRRIHWNNRGCKSIVWRCLSRLEPTSAIEPCVARTVNELTLMDVVLKAINNTCTNPEPFIATLQKNIADAVKLSDSASTEEIDVKLEALQKELIKKATGKEDYNKIADEIFRLRELRNASTMAGVTRDEQIKRINDLQDFIKEQKVEVSEFDEALVRRLIEKIMVFDDYFEVEFKSGVKVNIKG